MTKLSNFDRSKWGFDWSKNKFDWSGTNWARQIQTKIFNAFLINRKIYSINWKYGKLKFLENKGSFMQKPLKRIYFINKMHDYEFKSFSKNIWIQPWSSKNKIFTLFVPKTESINMFCIKIKENIILDGQTNFTLNFMY